MRFSYIEKIKANISIAASKKTTHLLEGLYCSIFKGQSLDFDDLRDYVVGDNYKDIDWKSSIRHGSLLVRRFVTFRKHNILFLIDTGEKMSGDTSCGETKSSVALYTLGTLGYLVNKNGDEIGAIYANNSQIVFNNFKPNLAHLEFILNDLENCIQKQNTKNINDLLGYAVRNQKKRMILVVISDLDGLNELDEKILKKASINHDLLFINIDDATMSDQYIVNNKTKQEKYDIDAKSKIPKFFANNKDFARQEKQLRDKIMNDKASILRKYRMSVGTIETKKKIPTRLIDLLERHNHEIRR